MAELEDRVLKQFKTELSKKKEVSDKLADVLIVELQKDNPNPERLAGIIQLKKEYFTDD